MVRILGSQAVTPTISNPISTVFTNAVIPQKTNTVLSANNINDPVNQTNTLHVPSNMERMSNYLIGHSMKKPCFADCWVVGSRDSLKVIESYSMPMGDVVIGIADDGEIEYNLTPREYTYNRSLLDILGKAIDGIRDDYRKKGAPWTINPS